MAKPRIEVVRKGDLEAFALKELAECPRGGVLPISPSRARAWAANPHAEPDDAVLLVARVDGRCGGYLGLLPGLLQLDGRTEPMSWLSALFVPESLRAQAIGGLLLMRAIALGRTLGAIGSSQEAERTYAAIGFAPPRELPYFELDLLRRQNWLGLPLRALRVGLQSRGAQVPHALDWAIAGCAGIGLSVVLPALCALAERSFGAWQARPLERLPEGAGRQDPGTCFVRDRAFLEWMLRHPWVSTERGETRGSYFFDDFRAASFHRAYALHSGASPTPAGWVILWFDVQGARRRLHLLDYQLQPEVAAEALLATALREALRLRANLVYLPVVCDTALRRLGPAARLFSQERRRSFYRPGAGSSLRGAIERLRLHHADGDIGFA
jgi:GNAT superfamily N-acetyltransferase